MADGKVIIETALDAKGFEQDLESLDSRLTSAASTMQNVGGKLMATSAATLGLGGAAVKTAASFEGAMSQVQATMGITKDATDMVHGEMVNSYDALSAVAQEMGASTKFSATEAAEALNYLALAGYNTEKQIDALPSVLTLASAGDMDLAYASDLVTDSMSALQLETKDLDMFIDQMAKTASRSNTSVSQLGEAILVTGGQAKLCNMSTTDLNTALGILADNGIKGSEGGTMLRNVLKNLYTPTDLSAEALENLGIVTANADGSLRNAQDVLIDLQNAMDGLTEEERVQAMSDIFDARTISGANALLNNCTDRWNDLSSAIDDSAGSAQLMADTQLDNLNGALTILKSSLEAASISIGNMLMPYIKKAGEYIQELVDKFNGLDDSQKERIVKIAMAIALAVGTLGTLLVTVGAVIKAVNTIKTAVTGLQIVWTAFTSGVLANPITWVILAIVAAVALLVTAFKHLWDTNEEFRNTMTSIWENIKNKFNEFCQGIVDRINELGFNFEDISELIKAVWEELCNFLAPIFEGVWKQVENILDVAMDIITGFLDIIIGLFTGDWEQLWTGVKEIFGGIWDFMLATFENWGNTLVSLLDVVCSWFGTTWEEVWQGIVDFFVGVWDGIKTFFSDLWTGIKEVCISAWNGIVSFFTETIPSFIESVGQWFLDLPNKIAYALGYAIGTLIQWGIDMFNWATQTLPQIIESIVIWFSELPAKIWEWLLATIQKVIEWDTQMKAKAIEVGTNFVTNIENFIKELPSKVWNFLLNTINKVSEFANNLKSEATQAANGFVTNLLNGVKGLPDKFREIGSNIVNGIWNGISASWDWLTEEVKGLANSLLQGAKDALGIASPSKKFAWIGEMSALGVEKGWDKVDVMGDISNDITRGYNQLNNAMSVDVNSNGVGGRGLTQIINVNKEVSTPDDIARVLRIQSRYPVLGGV